MSHCAWTHVVDAEENLWDTACGNQILFEPDTGPWREGFQFCSYCGKRLDELHVDQAPPPEPERDDAR